MKQIIKVTAAGLMCFIALITVIGMAGCVSDTTEVSEEEEMPVMTSPENGGRPMNRTEFGFDITEQIEYMESLGYDLADIRTAIDAGNTQEASRLLMELMQEHRDELSMPNDAFAEGGEMPQRPDVEGGEIPQPPGSEDQ